MLNPDQIQALLCTYKTFEEAVIAAECFTDAQLRYPPASAEMDLPEDPTRAGNELNFSQFWLPEPDVADRKLVLGLRVCVEMDGGFVLFERKSNGLHVCRSDGRCTVHKLKAPGPVLEALHRSERLHVA